MSTVWNPSDATGSLSFSNTNHTVTSTGGGNLGVRSVGKTYSATKRYMEFSSILSPGGSGSYGFAASGDTLGGSGQFGISPGGTFLGIPIGAPDGHVVCMAVDMDNKKAWCRLDAGIWNNNAGYDPSSNTGGADISGLTFPIYIYTWLQNNPGHVTLNAGDSAFAQSVPSGFTAWDLPIVFAYSQPRIIG